MKLPWTFAVVLTASSYYAAIQTQANTPVTPEVTSYNWKSHTEEEIQGRIAKITLPFETRYSQDIRDKIKDYVTAGYKDTEVMMGRSVLYFPIFDHYLATYQLPRELKYLPMIESGLKPTAESAVGAVGLWQFMPYTARQYGLTVNDVVDERKDAYKSTEAAVKMMAELYAQFNDWALVLAAYNCGAGRVKSAIKAAGGAYDFWAIQPYLPLQTQKYVPTFIAAAYVANYFSDHNLQQRFPRFDLGEVRGIKIYQNMSFREIAQKSGVDPYQLQILNPAYTQGYIPSSATGNFLLLPTEAARQFVEKVNVKVDFKGTNALAAPLNMFKNDYVVRAGERIEDLANQFKCSVRDIMRWNDLTLPEVFVHQQLIVFLHKPAKRA